MEKRILSLILILISSLSTNAGWHHGKINMVAMGYDGKTISIGQNGYSGTNCTCYSTWPDRYCLDFNRDTHEKEYALILSAKARDKSVSIHIDEKTCKINAIYES